MKHVTMRERGNSLTDGEIENMSLIMEEEIAHFITNMKERGGSSKQSPLSQHILHFEDSTMNEDEGIAFP